MCWGVNKEDGEGPHDLSDNESSCAEPGDLGVALNPHLIVRETNDKVNLLVKQDSFDFKRMLGAFSFRAFWSSAAAEETYLKDISELMRLNYSLLLLNRGRFDTSDAALRVPAAP